MKKLMLLVAALAFTAVTVAQEPVKKVEKKAKVEKTHKCTGDCKSHDRDHKCTGDHKHDANHKCTGNHKHEAKLKDGKQLKAEHKCTNNHKKDANHKCTGTCDHHKKAEVKK